MARGNEWRWIKVAEWLSSHDLELVDYALQIMMVFGGLW